MTAKIRTYSEKKAAEVLSMPRATLQSWRTRRGVLGQHLFAPAPADNRPAALRRTTPVQYRADIIDAIAAGERGWDE